MSDLKLKNPAPPPIPDQNHILDNQEIKNFEEKSQATTALTGEKEISSQNVSSTQARPAKKWPANTQYYVGIDIGSVALKTVVLAVPSKGKAETICMDEYLVAEEGITDEVELYQAVGKRVNSILDSKKKHHVCLGVPQFFGSVLIKDFPVALTEKDMANLVDAEALQLSHLSENHFFHDWQQLQPTSYQKNPIFIAVCREESVRDYYQTFINSGLLVDDLSFTGLANINTLLYLHPELKKEPGLQVVMDIGAENINVVLFGRGNLLAINTLSYGSNILTQAIKQQFGMSENLAEQAKISQKYSLSNNYETAFLREKARTFAIDLQGIIKEWLSSMELVDGFDSAVDGELKKVWLCGNGSLLKEMPTFLEGLVKCPFEIFGPKSSKLDHDPAFVNAYGLALFAAGLASYNISFLPKEISQANFRKKEAWWLAGSVAAMATIGFSFLGLSYFKTSSDVKVFREESERISLISGRVASITRQQKEINRRDLQVLPMITYGNVAQRVLCAWNIINGENALKMPYVDGQKMWPVFWQITLSKSLIIDKENQDRKESFIPFMKKETKKENRRNSTLDLIRAQSRGLAGTRFSEEKSDEVKLEYFLNDYVAVNTLSNELPLYGMFAIDKRLSEDVRYREDLLAKNLKNEACFSTESDRISGAKLPQLMEISKNLEKRWNLKKYNSNFSVNIFPFSFIFKDKLFIKRDVEKENQQGGNK